MPLIIIPLFMCEWNNAAIHLLWQKNWIFSLSAPPVPVSAHWLMARRRPCTIFSNTSCPLPPLWTCVFLHSQTRTWAGLCSPCAAGASPSESSWRRKTSPSAARRYLSSLGLVRESHLIPPSYVIHKHGGTCSAEVMLLKQMSQQPLRGHYHRQFWSEIREALLRRSRPKSLCVLRLLLSGRLGEFCGGEWRHNSSCLSEWRLPLHALPWVRVIALPTCQKIVRCRSESRRLSLLHFINYCSCILLDWELTK